LKPKSPILKKVISFDLDGTIVDSAYGNVVWLEGIPEIYARRHSLALDEAMDTVKREYDSVGDAHLLWYDIDYWLRRFDLTVSVPDLLHRYSHHIRMLPHIEEVVRTLAERYVLVIASNAARIFVEKELEHTGLGRYFTRVISATSDYGMVKQDEGFFLKLCSLLDVSPAEVIHVGDHVIFDVQVPRRVGIDSYHYDPSGCADDRAITDFRELLRLL
jgi:HAD superfamily hydrolase (TIGR01549 family)